MSKLDEVLEGSDALVMGDIYRDAIKELFKEIIGEDEFPKDESLSFKQVKAYTTAWWTTRNQFRAELRQKVEEL